MNIRTTLLTAATGIAPADQPLVRGGPIITEEPPSPTCAHKATAATGSCP